jgi:uncharacterized membrane protein
MRLRTAEIVVLAIVILSFAIALYFPGTMPERMASHWNIRNEVDGYMSRFWGLFLVPFIMFAFFLLYLAIPRIDPLRHNITEFRKYFDRFIVVFFLFLLYLYCLTLVWNAGHRFVMIRLMAPGFAVLFYFVGVMLEHAKRNWFVGIRTPWTLSSVLVWDETHKVGGRLFKIVAVLCLFAIPFYRYAVYFILVPVVLVTAYMIVYSYQVYHRREAGGSDRTD